MFEFRVKGISEAQVEIDRGWPTRVISAIKVPLLGFEHQGDHHLIVDVDDIHSVSCEGNPATSEMIREVLAHTCDLKDDDRLLVHCFAGQSRSTALMIGILIQHGMSPQAAFDAVKENRPVLMPNQLISELLDDHFGLKGDLVKIVLDYIRDELARTREFYNETVSAAQVASMKKLMDLFRD